jgi:hypothetical protein
MQGPAILELECPVPPPMNFPRGKHRLEITLKQSDLVPLLIDHCECQQHFGGSLHVVAGFSEIPCSVAWFSTAVEDETAEFWAAERLSVEQGIAEHRTAELRTVESATAN